MASISLSTLSSLHLLWNHHSTLSTVFVDSFYDEILAAIVVFEGSSAPVGHHIALLTGSEADLDKAKEKSNSIIVRAVDLAPPTTTEIEAATKTVETVVAVPVERNSDGGVIATPFAKKLCLWLKSGVVLFCWIHKPVSER